MLALLRKHMDSKGKQAKLKSPAQLQELLDVTRGLLSALDVQPPGDPPNPDADETREKFRIVKVRCRDGKNWAETGCSGPQAALGGNRLVGTADGPGRN